MENLSLEQKLIDLFGDIVFNESEHRYFLNGKTAPSVSTVIKQFYKPFDDSKYPQHLRDQWKQKGRLAAEKGTQVHLFAEHYLDGAMYPQNDKELGVVQFFMDHDLRMIKAEQRLYHYGLDYFGTADLLFEYQGKIILADWKTNETLHKDYGDNLYPPFDSKINNALHRYYLQLNHYKMALEQAIKIDEMWIVHLTKADGNFYKVYEVPDITKKLIDYYDRTRRDFDHQVDNQ